MRLRKPIIQVNKTVSVFERCSFSDSTSVTPTEISKQPRRPGSPMSARFNVTRSSSDSQTYPPFAVHVDSETSKDRDQFTGRGLSRLVAQALSSLDTSGEPQDHG